jgi:serine/threonine protein kinase
VAIGSDELKPGAAFHGRYRIVRRIGAGGMGAIFEAIDLKTNSRRALKVMLASALHNADFRARFESEALITGPIESDHLVRVSDAGVDEATNMPFLVMDMLSGDDLGKVLHRRGPLPPDEVVLYLSQVARALDRTHAAGIVHRDLKPENLYLTQRDDGSPCVKVLDFGIAKLVAGSNAGKATRALGTPYYMSPEQIRGDGTIGPRADVYSLGHIAYTALAGEPYWHEDSVTSSSPYDFVCHVLNGMGEPPCDRALRRGGVLLPPTFDAWFAKATATTQEARFERATDAIAALGAALLAPPRISIASTPASGPRPMSTVVLAEPLAASTDIHRGAAFSPLVSTVPAMPPPTAAVQTTEPSAPSSRVVTPPARMGPNEAPLPYSPQPPGSARRFAGASTPNPTVTATTLRQRTPVLLLGALLVVCLVVLGARTHRRSTRAVARGEMAKGLGTTSTVTVTTSTPESPVKPALSTQPAAPAVPPPAEWVAPAPPAPAPQPARTTDAGTRGVPLDPRLWRKRPHRPRR